MNRPIVPDLIFGLGAIGLVFLAAKAAELLAS